MKKKWLWSLLGTVAAVIVMTAVFVHHRKGKITLDEVAIADTAEVESITLQYGLPIDDYEVAYGVVDAGQHLSGLLQAHGLNGWQVHKLSKRADGVFDVRSLRAGQGYATFKSKDSIDPHLDFFVYEENPRSYVVFDLRDDYAVYRGYNPVEWKSKSLKGQLNTSLWVAVQEQGASPLLALELSNIYGWSIDFFGLQAGDKFSVLYEQEYVDSHGLDSFHILAAAFTHADSVYYAIPFEQDGEMLYYNEHGQSLEGTFLKAPLDYYRITSRFSNSRYHPVLRRRRAHHGVDYAAPVGTPVYATADGTVIARAYQANGGGNYVKIKHNSIYTTTYMHLSRFAKGLKVGQRVRQKEVIGYVGSTGLSTGPHLDYRVHENGKPINPLLIRSKPKKPIAPERMSQFQAVCDSLVRQLQAL